MTHRERARIETEKIKKQYPKGTRVLLIHMGDDPNPILPNTYGTVESVDDMGTVHCRFDNGRCLGLISGIDDFRKLTEQELWKGEENEKNDDLLAD